MYKFVVQYNMNGAVEVSEVIASRFFCSSADLPMVYFYNDDVTAPCFSLPFAHLISIRMLSVISEPVTEKTPVSV